MKQMLYEKHALSCRSRKGLFRGRSEASTPAMVLPSSVLFSLVI